MAILVRMNPSANPQTMGDWPRMTIALYCIFFALFPARPQAQLSPGQTSGKITLVADLEKGPGSMIKSSFDNLYFSALIGNGHHQLLKFDGEEITILEHRI